MNARPPRPLPIDLDPRLEQSPETVRETPERQRADLSLDISKSPRFETEIERQTGEAKATAERIEKGEKPEKFNWMPLTLNLALFGVGAYSMYKIGSWAKAEVKEAFFDEEDDKEKKDKNKFPIASTVALAVATGVAMQKDYGILGGALDWFKKTWNTLFLGDSISKFFKTLTEKGVKAAYEQLTYHTDEPFIKTFSEELNIEARHLAELQTVAYGRFTSARKKDQSKSYLTKAMDLIHLPVEDIPFTDADDELRRVQQEDRLAAYIEEHKAELEVSDDELKKMPIGDILKALLTKREKHQDPGEKPKPGVTPKPEPDSKPSETHEAEPSTVLNLTDDPEKVRSVLPHSADAFQRAEKARSKHEYAAIIAGGALADGGTIVHNEWGTFLAKGPVGILITSGELLWEEFKAVGAFLIHTGTGNYDAAGEDLVNVGEAWYENHGMWFLGAGASLGAVTSMWNGTSLSSGMLRGGLTGATLGPIGTVWRSIKLVKGGISASRASATGLVKVFTTADYGLAYGRHLSETGKTAFRRGEVRTTGIKEKALVHIDGYERYYELIQRSKSTRFTDVHIAQLVNMDPKHLERMEDFHFQQFANSWEAYQKSIGVAHPVFPIDRRHFKDHRAELEEVIVKFREQVGAIRAERKDIEEAKARLQESRLASETPHGRIEALRQSSKEADEYMETVIKKIEEMHVDRKPQTEIDEYTREARAHLDEVRSGYKRALELLKGHTRELSKQDQTALRTLLKTEMAHASGVRGVMREVGERSTGKVQIVFGVAAIGLEYMELREQDKEKYALAKINEWGSTLGWDTLQIIADVLSPFGISDWYTVTTGKELITGKEAGAWNRLTRVIFGAYNLSTDTLAAIGGGATAEVGGAGGAAIYAGENALEGTLRAAGKAPEVIAAAKTLVPEVQGLAKALGGYQELFRVMKNISGTGMKATMAAEVGMFGYSLGKEIFFDTKDQTPIELDLPDAEDEPVESAPIDNGKSGRAGTGRTF